MNAKSEALKNRMSPVERGTRKLDKFFKGMGGKSELTLLQERRKAESIKSDTGYFSKAETAKREAEHKAYKEKVRLSRIEQPK
jgi:hypothetical protein